MNKTLILGDGPTSFRFIPDPNSNMPSLAIASDLRGLNAGAVGYSKSTIVSAIGEFIERHYAYFKISEDAIIDASILLPSIKHAYGQLVNEEINGSIKVTECFNLINGEKTYVPINLISLGKRHLNESLPNRDTSGFAIHQTLQKAIKVGIAEFIERQCIMRWWLERDSLIQVHNYPEHPIALRMAQLGEFRVYDLTYPPFEGCCLFCVFLGNGSPVWFSSGISYSHDPKEAFEKAVCELWQIYLFVYGVSIGEIDKSSITDSYQKDFLSYDTFDTAIFFRKIHSHKNFSELNKIKCVLDEIKNISGITDELYVYRKIINSNSRQLHLVKIFSPGFFLHIKPTAKLNIDNSYSKNFKKIHLDKDLPFP